MTGKISASNLVASELSTSRLLLPIVLVIFLVGLSASLAAVDIVIEYNVISECTGNIVLALNPQSVLRGGSVTPSASGLSGCDAKVVYFKSTSCSGTQVSSCSVSGAGCTGASFSAPPTIGSYAYYACIDKNDNSVFTDAGESDSKTLTVETSTPSVGALTFSPSEIDLIAGGVKPMKVLAVISNAEGASYISSCYGYLWDSSVTAPYTDVKANYANSSCLLSCGPGTTCNCECGFALKYYDINGTWKGNITGKTQSNKVSTNQGSFLVNTHTSHNVMNSINFGTVKVGDVNVPALSNPLKINNTGNVKLKVNVSSTDHFGKDDKSWVIGAGNITYNSSATGMGTLIPLTKSPAQFNPTGGIPVYPNSVPGITEKGIFYIYHYISIPPGFKAQIYNLTYSIDLGSAM